MSKLLITTSLISIALGIALLITSIQIAKDSPVALVQTANRLFRPIPPDVASPSKTIQLDQIQVDNDKVVIKGINKPILALLTDTNSMDPTLDAESILIEQRVSDVGDLQVGDIVSYSTDLSEGVIVHRISDLGEDEDGWYARFKGDNLASEDPEKVREHQIQRRVLGILY